MSTDLPAWYAVALHELACGVVEVPGAQHNDRILQYHQTTSLHATDDETPWCSAFVSWCMRRAGIRGTDSAAARTWCTWGIATTYRPGAIVVLSRPPSTWSGHVGFFVAAALPSDDILLLGGNQGDKVSVAAFPRSRVLATRWPYPLV